MAYACNPSTVEAEARQALQVTEANPSQNKTSKLSTRATKSTGPRMKQDEVGSPKNKS